MSPTTPKAVGTCSIGDLIGKGGMAEVYAGTQETLKRRVAIKALNRDMKDDEEACERFRREALAIATLQHENIIAVHDLIEKYNRLYIIMEFVDGVDLVHLLKEGPLPTDIGLIVGSSLAAALAHAHFRRVLHRDIKPGNVMITRSGQVKLTDFGIAKDQTLDDLTRKGFVVGTPRYLSPEQAMGGRADTRSDLYALGVLLFEAFTGSRAFSGKNQAETLVAVAKGARPRLRQRSPHLPRALDKIVYRCMRLDPADRYQRATDLKRDLDRLLNAVVRGNPTARMVAFLKERGQIDEQAMTLLASDELAAVEPVSKPNTVLSRIRMEVSVDEQPGPMIRLGTHLLVFLLGLLLLAGALGVAWLLAPEKLQHAAETISTWLRNATP